MKGSPRLSFQKGDWIAIVGVVALTIVVACFYGNLGSAKEGNEGTPKVQIFLNNQLQEEHSLDEKVTILVQGDYQNLIEISEGKVAIKESDCPGEDCVHSGTISRVGRSIVCLPNKVEVRIIGGDGTTDGGLFDGLGTSHGEGDNTVGGSEADDEVDFIVR